MVRFVYRLSVASWFIRHCAARHQSFDAGASEIASIRSAESCFAWWRSKLRFVSICKHLVSCYMYSVPEVTSNDTRAHSKHTHFANQQKHSVFDVFTAIYVKLFVVRLFPFNLTVKIKTTTKNKLTRNSK